MCASLFVVVLNIYTYGKSCLCASVMCYVMLYDVCIVIFVMFVPVQCLMCLCGMFVIYCVKLQNLLFVMCLCCSL